MKLSVPHINKNDINSINKVLKSEWISGLTKPHSGLIQSDNIDINKNILVWRNKIGYVPQNIYLLDDTIQNADRVIKIRQGKIYED